MSGTISAIFQVQRGTAAQWTSNNPVLLAGQIGFEKDTNSIKIGDGTTAWNSLAYFVGATDNANTLRPTTGAPSVTADLQAGDFAYDALANVMYGPYTGTGLSGSWPSGVWLGAEIVRGSVPLSGGYLLTANGGGTSTGAISDTNVRMVPVTVKRTTTFTGLSTFLTVAAVGATSPLIVMGVYADDGNGRPLGAPITGSTVSVTPVGASTTANTDVAFGTPLTLQPGNYFLAIALTFTSTFSTNPTFVTLTPVGNTWLSGTTALGNGSSKGWENATGGAGALPTLTAPFQGSGGMPIVALKVQ